MSFTSSHLISSHISSLLFFSLLASSPPQTFTIPRTSHRPPLRTPTLLALPLTLLSEAQPRAPSSDNIRFKPPHTTTTQRDDHAIHHTPHTTVRQARHAARVVLHLHQGTAEEGSVGRLLLIPSFRRHHSPPRLISRSRSALHRIFRCGAGVITKAHVQRPVDHSRLRSRSAPRSSPAFPSWLPSLLSPQSLLHLLASELPPTPLFPDHLCHLPLR